MSLSSSPSAQAGAKSQDPLQSSAIAAVVPTRDATARRSFILAALQPRPWRSRCRPFHRSIALIMKAARFLSSIVRVIILSSARGEKMMRTVNQAKYDEKRRHILDAARHAFIEKGFHGTSIADICAAAEMSPGHLYHYFSSKEAIIEAIVEMGLERVATMTGRLARKTNIVDALLEEIEQRQGGQRPRFGLMLEMEAEAARNPPIAKIMH